MRVETASLYIVAFVLVASAGVASVGCNPDEPTDPDDAGEADIADADADSSDGSAEDVAEDADSGPVDTADDAASDSTDGDASPTDSSDGESPDGGDVDVVDADTSDPLATVGGYVDTFEREARNLSCRFSRRCVGEVSGPGEPPLQGENACAARDNLDWMYFVDPSFARQIRRRFERTEAVRRGYRDYDRERAATCLRKIRDELSDDTPCELEEAPLEACEEAITPARAEGDACLGDGDCGSGLRCDGEARPDACGGSCVPVEAGDPCTRFGQCPDGSRCIRGVCFSGGAEGTECTQTYQCGEDLVCRQGTGDETCQPPLEEGDSCDGDPQCGDGLSCRPDGDGGTTCQPVATTRAACNSQGDCASSFELGFASLGWMDWYEEGDRICDWKTDQRESRQCYEVRSRGAGEPCIESAETCERGLVCLDETCREFTRKSQGESCDAETAICDAGLYCTPETAAGESSVCRPAGQEGDLCADDTFGPNPPTTCDVGLYCRLADESAEGVGRCRPRLPEGESCDDQRSACAAELYCGRDGTCQSRTPAGGSCTAPSGCAEGDCLPGEDESVCGGRYADCESDQP